jgi:DNA segregation ATPase FtsK/SpoIIIE-like protein
MSNKDLAKEVEQLKTELTGLKVRQRRIEDFLLDFPNIEDYLQAWDVDASNDDLDDLYEEAVKIIKQYDRASASLIQRRLMIGYARAARILDQLEKNGVVGPAKGVKPRKILIDKKPEKKEK